MGDIVHGLPAAAYLKKRLPELTLHWMVEAPGIPLLAANPVVDRTIVFPKRKWQEQLCSVSGLGATALEAGRFIRELKSEKYEAVLDFQGLLKSSLLGCLSGANLRFGFKGTREGAERLLTHGLDVGDYFADKTHIVELNLALAEFASRIILQEPGPDERKPSFIYDDHVDFPLPTPPVETNRKIRDLLQGAGLGNAKRLVFIPGTTWESKIWAADKWVELGRLCLSRLSGPLILLGGAAEKSMNGMIAGALGADKVIDLTGATEIADLIALFQEADIVVGGDTGPLHLAAAVGRAMVYGVFGSTPTRRNGPYGKKSTSISLELSCQPCFKKVCPLGTLACLRELSARRVFECIKFD